MGQRREARARAVQFLFQHDLNPSENLNDALERFWEAHRLASRYDDNAQATWGAEPPAAPPDAAEATLRLFAEKLIHGVLANRDEIDAIIRRHTQNWEIHRIAAVDRNILRLAIHEIMHREDIPPVVSINEAIELAKQLSTEQSGRFVNGILDKVKGETLRPARTAAH